MPEKRTFKILSLDGGGSKGFYSLGLLSELEKATRRPLYEFFDAIYGTSTGAIIAALIGYGHPVEKVLSLYRKHVPTILKPWFPRQRSARLREVGATLFEKATFRDFKTLIGIVATNWDHERPTVFKSSVEAAFGMKNSFVPGFGLPIADIVTASCSATPFFKPCYLKLGNYGVCQMRDGGFSANNPSLYALYDALGPLGKSENEIRLLSVGVGNYPLKKQPLHIRALSGIPTARMLQKSLSTNANTTEDLLARLFPSVQQLRINCVCNEPELATDFLECRADLLEKLVGKGKTAFGKNEQHLQSLFENYA
jgi:patatin-like phospholipase/acyl hydrolase